MRTTSIRTALLLLSLSVTGGAALAQTQTDAAPAATAHPAQKLTAEQRQKMSELRASARDQAAIIRNDQSLTAEQKQQKLQALRASTREQMKSVLTPEQQQAFAARRAQHEQKMAAKLNLTEDQQAKLKALRASTHDQRQAVLANTSLTSEQKQQQLAQIRESNKTQLATILTPDQLAQMQKMRHGRHSKQL